MVENNQMCGGAQSSAGHMPLVPQFVVPPASPGTRYSGCLPRAPKSILISAGEASGDYYAALLLAELGKRWPETEFFGCAGAHLRAGGLRPVIRAEDLAVVGIAEVAVHLPRIWRRFREL